MTVVMVRSGVECKVGRRPALEGVPVQSGSTWMVWILTGVLLLLA